MTTYQLDVHIDPNDIRRLKEGGYNLCIAKMVNGIYSVVWYDSRHFLQNNTFEWVDEYQVFGVNHFKVGALVQAATNSEDIQPGQSCELEQNGVMESAIGVAQSTGHFSVKNKYGAINIGINAKLYDKMYPVFVTPTATTAGTTVSLQPVDTIMVWFSQMQTGTMIYGAEAESIEVKYDGRETSKTVNFSGGSWVLQ